MLILSAAFIFVGANGVYNLTLHPLAHIPGPKLAGMTKLYQMFWAYYRGRSIYYQKVREMHQIYGTIVRIAPDELSLIDEKSFKEIYSVHSEYAKDHTFYRAMGVSEGMFGAIDGQSHRALRAPWSRFFSKTSISQMRHRIEYRVELLSKRMDKEIRASGLIPLQTLLHATSMDIISDFTLPASFELLEDTNRTQMCISEIFDRARWIWILMANSIFYWLLSQTSRLMSRLSICDNELDRIYKVRLLSIPCSE